MSSLFGTVLHEAPVQLLRERRLRALSSAGAVPGLPTGADEAAVIA